MTKFSALFWPMAFVFAALAFTMSANAAQLGYCYPSSGCSGKPSTVTDAGSKTGVSNCASFRRDDNLSQDVNMSACSVSIIESDLEYGGHLLRYPSIRADHPCPSSLPPSGFRLQHRMQVGRLSGLHVRGRTVSTKHLLSYAHLTPAGLTHLLRSLPLPQLQVHQALGAPRRRYHGEGDSSP